jgi:hypothetical protein
MTGAAAVSTATIQDSAPRVALPIARGCQRTRKATVLVSSSDPQSHAVVVVFARIM